jgi:hypothetical protein
MKSGYQPAEEYLENEPCSAFGIYGGAMTTTIA